jgi:hypothetical protein
VRGLEGRGPGRVGTSGVQRLARDGGSAALRDDPRRIRGVGSGSWQQFRARPMLGRGATRLVPAGARPGHASLAGTAAAARRQKVGLFAGRGAPVGARALRLLCARARALDASAGTRSGTSAVDAGGRCDHPRADAARRRAQAARVLSSCADLCIRAAADSGTGPAARANSGPLRGRSAMGVGRCSKDTLMAVRCRSADSKICGGLLADIVNPKARAFV